MPQLSIIVPAYNMEQYIKLCMDSILQQSFVDFELIVVDDGSTDGTRDIVLQQLQADSRIHYFHKENGGVSSARNLGLNKANGKFVCFIDADDAINPDYLSHIMQEIKVAEADCYIWGITKIGENGYKEVWTPLLEGMLDRTTFLSKFLSEQLQTHEGIYGFVPNKLLRRDIIQQHDLRFDTNISLMEDYNFFLDYYSHCRTFYCFSEAGYHYYIRCSSDKPRHKHPVCYPSLIAVHEKCHQLLINNDALTTSNLEQLNQTIGSLAIAMFLEMNNVTQSRVRQSLLFLADNSIAMSALKVTKTRWRFLRRQIQQQNVFAIYMFVKCWQVYLAIRTLNI